ncbi:MAG: hypothetical protein OES12_10850, partial [Anaerolineae bacterium]|nr:hypothetical protein [Anaerolineae bacterium]
LRLYHLIEGSDHFAVGACKCGREYRFYLGQNTLAIDQIAQTNRWSPDVCFPIFFNDLVSGFVAGKSSAIYLMVMNNVMREALDKAPVPVLVPKNLDLKGTVNGNGNGRKGSARFDSLIYRYLAG